MLGTQICFDEGWLSVEPAQQETTDELLVFFFDQRLCQQLVKFAPTCQNVGLNLG